MQTVTVDTLVPVEELGLVLDGLLDWAGWGDPLIEIACYERAVARLQGAQIRAMAGMVAQERTDLHFADPGHAEQSAAAEIALLLGDSPGTVETRVREAVELVERLPATTAALCAGTITLSRARVVHKETSQLAAEHLPAVEAAVLPKAPRLTPANLRRTVRRMVEKIDTEALRKRVRAARAARWVAIRPEPDGTAMILARLPVEQAYAVYGVIDTLAHANKVPGQERSIDQLRADALVDLICHPGNDPFRIRHEVRVLVPADLLLGTGTESGRMADGSAIPDEISRAIATDARWRRILTDPVSGQTLDVGAETYKPSRRLTEFIRARDQHCRWPGCRRPAHRCELDHTVTFGNGGKTVRINIGTLCKHHHRIKHLPGWICTQDPDGTLTFSSPHGQIYRTRPPTADAEEPTVELLRPAMPADPPF